MFTSLAITSSFLIFDLFRPPDDSRGGSYIFPLSFLYHYYFTGHNLLDHGRPPCQECIIASVLGEVQNIDSDISPTPPLIFTGVIKCEIWPQFSTPLVYESPSFRNEATCLKSKRISGVPISVCAMPKFAIVRGPLTSENYWLLWGPVKMGLENLLNHQ